MAKWKGLVAAGGSGSRLWPLTRSINKHLLPVYDKPMIYYPLTTLMLSGIRDIILTSSPESLEQLRELLGDGGKWGVSFTYIAQRDPRGVADCLLVAAEETNGCNVALILGDNIFYGASIGREISRLMDSLSGATVFAYEVSNPAQFGVVEVDQHLRPLSIEEKPAEPRSRYAIPGLYLYDQRATAFARSLKPSARGEFEITDVNRAYLEAGALTVSMLGRGVAWLDGGTAENLFEASQFIKVMEERTGLKVACPEEVAWRMGYIDDDGLRACIGAKIRNGYQSYLAKQLENPLRFRR